MVGVVLVSENKEAQEMLKSAHRLVGRTPGMTSVMLRCGQPVSKMKSCLKRAIKRIESPEGILLMTDYYGSTQFNVCKSFIKKGSVELITGYNIPMVIKLATLRENLTLKNLMPMIQKYGREHLCHFKGD